MIWVRGALVADEALRISVLDQTFEHGLGLFETLRTWNGHPTLLPRHLDRLRRSAAELGLAVDPADLPDSSAVAALLRAEGRAGDAILRITTSGGIRGQAPAAVWMRLNPSTVVDSPGAATISEVVTIGVTNPLDRHKTLNYWRKRLAYEAARANGDEEVLLATEDGQVWEGSRTNVFLVAGGRLETPSAPGPFLPGIMRQVVIEQAGALGIKVAEAPIRRERLGAADEVFLTNAARGLVPVGSLFGRVLPAPGPITARLGGHVRSWLDSGGRAGPRPVEA